MEDRAFSKIPINQRSAKPRTEGLTNVETWRTDLVSEIAEGVGLSKLMFEAADPEVFEWYVKTWGPEVNCSWTTTRSSSWNA